MLTGDGGVLCAGLDLKHYVRIRSGETRGVPARQVPYGCHRTGPTRIMLDKPAFAGVEGYAVAGGLEIACWCDMRLAARDAAFGVYCRRWGMPLANGGTVRLKRIVGQGNALDIILT